MAPIHDEALHGTLTTPNLRKYVASDPSIINRPGGTKNITPLAAACWLGHIDVVKVLLAEAANPNALSPSSRTPLYFVTFHSPPANRFAILRALIAAKAKIDVPCDKDGNTPLMHAVSQIRDKRVVQELINRGANPKTKNAKGQTAETLAEKSGMKRHLRTKAERNSTSAQVVEVVVSLVLLVVSYTNSGFFKSAVRGVVKKLYNFSGKETKLAKELPKPTSPATVNDFKTSLDTYVRDSGINRFFAKNDPFIQKLAVKAHALRDDPTTDLGKPEHIKHLSRLALYHPVLFCDDSGSMANDDRFQNQLELVIRIARVATKIVPDDLAGIDLRFINAAGSDRLDANSIENAVKAVEPKGGTPIGTNLRSKILEPLVYNFISTRTLKRPILVCIITDGSPSGEPQDLFAQAILECKEKLKEAEYDPASVKFLINQIGTDEFATDFLESLRTDPRLEKALHCTADRLDDEFQNLKENERLLESWLVHTLARPLMERHEE